MLFSLVSTIACSLINIVNADIQFTSPPAAAVLAANTPVTVSWIESGAYPLLTDLTKFDLFLCAGGADIIHVVQLATIMTSAPFGGGNQVVTTVDPTLGGSDLNNAYFFRMVATLNNGGSLITYSPRFTLTGMSGKNNPAVIEGVQWNGANPLGPPKTLYAPQDPIAQHPMDPWNIPIGLQTGPIIYAPMQQHPGTKVSADKSPTPRYSRNPAIKIATTAMPPNSFVIKTQTQAVTWTYQQRQNAEPPAQDSRNGGDMHKFLKRWED